jgi:hypothetical protein
MCTVLPILAGICNPAKFQATASGGGLGHALDFDFTPRMTATAADLGGIFGILAIGAAILTILFG